VAQPATASIAADAVAAPPAANTVRRFNGPRGRTGFALLSLTSSLDSCGGWWSLGSSRLDQAITGVLLGR
jgi:hypothetical protein